MSKYPLLPFEIANIDSLGQGVSKLSDKVTFIPKTIIGEKGEAELMSEKKGVAFARLKNLSTKSPKRIDPVCPHFSQCPSCHFLHMNYDDEIEYKKMAFQNLFRKLPLRETIVVKSDQRLEYRNRIQLHYSLKSKLIGFRDSQTFSILEVPHCLIGRPEILKEVKRLYENKAWLKEAPAAPTEGHVEIYLHDNQLKLNWNKPYASGGFTQVFDSMNSKLKNILHQEWSQTDQLVDLFGGNGNLSNDMKYSKRLCIDSYQSVTGHEFFNQNLYDKNALRNISNELRKRDIKPTHLLLDPPRSGMKDLGIWLDHMKPQFVAYVSCDPHTLVRDLQTVKNYSLGKGFLLDFFPSTYHFETLVFLERNS